MHRLHVDLGWRIIWVSLETAEKGNIGQFRSLHPSNHALYNVTSYSSEMLIQRPLEILVCVAPGVRVGCTDQRLEEHLSPTNALQHGII